MYVLVLPVRRWLRVAVALTALFIVAPTPPSLRAQTPHPIADASGAKPHRGVFGDLPFESIDTLTGNVTLSFVDLSLPGYGTMDLNIVRTYNSKGNHWTFGIGGFPLRIRRPGPVSPPNQVFAQPHSGEIPASYRDYYPVLLTPDGGEHRVYNETLPTWSTAPTVFRSAAYWQYTASTRTLELPNGLICHYNADGLLTHVTDAFMNSLTVTWANNHIQTVTQSLGGGTQQRTLTFDWSNGTGGGIGAPWAVPWAVMYDGREWQYHRNGHGSLTPPNAPGSATEYHPEGRVSAYVTPEGGRVEYSYVRRNWRDRFDNTWTFLSWVVTERRTSGRAIDPGTWTFAYSEALGEQNVIDGPYGVRHVLRYDTSDSQQLVLGGRDTYQGSQLLDSMTTTYDPVGVADYSGFVTDQERTRTISRDGKTYQRTMTYIADGRVDIIDEVGDLSRHTNFDYVAISGRYMLPLPSSEHVTVAGDTASRTWAYNDITGFMESATEYGLTTAYTVDGPTGAVSSTTDPHGHQTAFSHDWGVTANVMTPEHTTIRSINADGTAASETRAGHTTAFEYDGAGRVTKVTPPIGSATKTTYDASGHWVETRRDNGSHIASWQRTHLDGFGRPIGTETAAGVLTRTSYDALGRKTFDARPRYHGEPERGLAYTYDGLGRRTAITDSSDSSQTHYAYTSVGIEITDARGKVTQQEWGAFGSPDDARLMSVTDPDSNVSSYEYTVLGNLKRVRQPGGTTRTWEYDPGSPRVLSETHPESGTTTYQYQQGRLSTKTNGNGISFEHHYDANDRLVRIGVANHDDHSVSISYDQADRRTRVRNAFVDTTYEYDAAGRVGDRRDRFAGGGDLQTRFWHDEWDRMERIRYSSGKEVLYQYDPDGRIERVQYDGAVIAETAYHASGGLKTLQYGNGIEEHFGETAQGYFAGVSSSTGPLQLAYDYDPVGNVKTIDDARSAYDQNFSYDNLDRLTEVGGFGVNTYGYDALGNRLTKALPSLSYTYDHSTKRLTSVAGAQPNPEVGSYEYDQAGNLTQDPNGVFAYTPFHMLATASVGGSTTSYRYDGDHQRSQKISHSGTELFIRSPSGQLLSEHVMTPAAPRWRRDYVYLGDRLLSSMSATQTVTVRFATSGSGAGESDGERYADVQVTTGDGTALLEAVSASYTSETGTASPSTDYAAGGGSVLFPAGSPSGTTAGASFTILNDRSNSEAPETFDLVLQPHTGLTLGTPLRHTVTITEDHLPATGPVIGDFDADRAADVAVFRSATATWHTAGQAPVQFGQPGDIGVAGDYDGDGVTDRAVYRPSSNEWHVQHQFSVVYGVPGDIPVPADYDGDGRTDIAMFRPSSTTWKIYHQADVQFGDAYDVPVPGRYNGGLAAQVAVYRPSTGMWYVRGGIQQQLGGPGFVPAQGDFDGNGQTEFAVFSPSTGEWRFTNRPVVGWGDPGDVPLPRDFDGDGRTDIAVYRPRTATWFVRHQFTQQHGSPGDLPAPRGPYGPRTVLADFDGNGRTDLALYRSVGSQWFVYPDAAGVQFGESYNRPVPGDYDGDGRVDMSTWDSATSLWRIRYGMNGNLVMQSTASWGDPGDFPVPGDYNGDGLTDRAVYRESASAMWFVFAHFAVQYGDIGDFPLPADYNGDGITDVAIYRPTTGWWYVKDQPGAQYGDPGDIPVPADFNGDGVTDVAVFRPSTGFWYVRGGASTQFGDPGDIPVPGDYDGDGKAEFAVFRPSTGVWYILGASQFVQYGEPSHDKQVVRIGGVQ